MNYKHLGVVGGGNMAQAIVNGAINQVVWADEICISNPHLEKLGLLRNQGVHLTTDNREAAAYGDIVLLAVKPQKIEEVLDGIDDLLVSKTVVSIVAGYSQKWLQERLPQAHIICVMPNTPLSLGKGATAITPMGDVPEKDYRFVSSMFLCAGGLFVVPAEKMNDIIPVNGSGPAFFFRIADIMAKEAVKRGIDYNMAVMMAAQTMTGAAEMLMKSGKTAEQLTREVCSPGGTTIAGLSAFEDMDIQSIFAETFRRCIDRAYELGK
ncbi:MAG: pyrroline-5-carboxylate reductase [Oscillospiraceae bacterium]|nr:pyrroline-5-carboxylate reductase [Oscillospiraceae bacterium]